MKTRKRSIRIQKRRKSHLRNLRGLKKAPRFSREGDERRRRSEASFEKDGDSFSKVVEDSSTDWFVRQPTVSVRQLNANCLPTSCPPLPKPAKTNKIALKYDENQVLLNRNLLNRNLPNRNPPNRRDSTITKQVRSKFEASRT